MSLETPKLSKKTEGLLAELFLELKGRKEKRHDWMTLAEMCDQIVKEFGNSVADAAKKLRVSTSLLNSIIRLKNLDPRVQEMVRKRLILFDSAQRLNTISPYDRQYDVSRLLIGLSNKQQRDLIQHALRYPEIDLTDFRKRLTGEKTRRENIRVVILPIRDEAYRSLQNASRREGVAVEVLLTRVVEEWLEGREKTKRH